MCPKKTTKQFIEESNKIHNLGASGLKYRYDKTVYDGAKKKVKIYCINCCDYFELRPTDHTSKKYGCQKCSKSRSEKLAIDITIHLLIAYGISGTFKSANPTDVPWLDGLYLDGLLFKDESIIGTWFPKFAIEYQGIQHYQYPNHYHRTKKEFDKQVRNDKIKKKKCKSNGVVLIQIPYTLSYRNERKMEKFITKKLKENKIIN